MAAVVSISFSNLIKPRFAPLPSEFQNFLPSSSLFGLSQLYGRRCPVPRAINFTAAQPDEPAKQHINGSTSAARRISEILPQPVKDFPWTKTLGKFYQFIAELVFSVMKYLFVPVLAISSLSEMSYCAHERKMISIPVPFLVGLFVAGILKDTVQELSVDAKERDFPANLLIIAAFFLLLKLPGPYYPYWARLTIPHFANGGLWRSIWSMIMWYRKAPGKTSTTAASD